VSYHHDFNFDFNQFVALEYSLSDGELVVNSWSLYYNNRLVIPDRETSAEIEALVAKFLEREYHRNSRNYSQDLQDCVLEKRYEGDR
jgi:hypothetical protein